MSVELKPVELYGKAIIQNNRITSVAITKFQIAGADPSGVKCAMLVPCVTPQQLAEKVFAVGDAVRVRSNAASLAPTLGSPSACDWNASNKMRGMGQIGAVIGIDRDGDIVVAGLGAKFWSPEFLEKVPTGQASSNDAAFKSGDKVVCDRVQSDYRGVPARLSAIAARVGEIGTVSAHSCAQAVVIFADGEPLLFPMHWLRAPSAAEIAAYNALQTAIVAFHGTDADPNTVGELVKRQLGKRARTE